MFDKLQDIICSLQLEKKQFLLAVSGGVDSMVLADLFLRLNCSFSVAHCNFQLREEASGDEQLVLDWCRINSIKCHSKKFETEKYCKQRKVGTQEAARELRYQFFRELLQENNLDVIGTAHHADDNIETVLFNLIRGTSIKGLTGMQMLEGDVFRPLLNFSKEEVTNYATEHKIIWREDASNNKNDYSRNFLRNEIIPKLESEFSNAKSKMLGTINRLNEVEQIYNHDIASRRKRLLVETGKYSYKVSIRKLLQQQPLRTIIYEVFSPFGLREKQIDELIKTMNAQAGARLKTDTHVLLNHRNHIVIEPKSEVEKKHYILEDDKGSLKMADGVLHWEFSDQVPEKFISDNNRAVIDAENVQFPLLIRSPRIADYFYPLGMKKKKKLSRFFIDQKMHQLDKEKQLVLECDKKVIWLIGQRIDDRFKIKNTTKRVLKLKWKHD